MPSLSSYQSNVTLIIDNEISETNSIQTNSIQTNVSNFKNQTSFDFEMDNSCHTEVETSTDNVMEPLTDNMMVDSCDGIMNSLNGVKEMIEKDSIQMNEIHSNSSNDTLNPIKKISKLKLNFNQLLNQSNHTTHQMISKTLKDNVKQSSGKQLEHRHGISRYAPYGTRFAATMRDGEYKVSHIAGDLANRARQRNGRGCRVDLTLINHAGELAQLEKALEFYQNAIKLGHTRPGPSEVLNHLRDLGIDFDYRKGDDAKLLQRNASNFFKRVMEHAQRISDINGVPNPILSSTTSSSQSSKLYSDSTLIEYPIQNIKKIRIEEEIQKAAEILGSFKSASMNEIEMEENEGCDSIPSIDIDIETIETEMISNISMEHEHIQWPQSQYIPGSFHSELRKHLLLAAREENKFYSEAAEKFDVNNHEQDYIPIPQELYVRKSYDVVSRKNYSDFHQPCYRKPTKPKQIKPLVEKPRVSAAVVSVNPCPLVRKGREGLAKGLKLKGLSRHSPYGTRFCAIMPTGEMKESHLAGDLADRARSADGKSQGELNLVLHSGEIKQLEAAWAFIKKNDHLQLGAGSVLDHLRDLNLDENHRKFGCKLLQKNAGNFFKRVQEFGKRREADAEYLASN
ncbi:hypothetical protein BC833DRAFT_626091 [Globomyces pollinis-pini]|nr:hypothetical protein BC833DRAFT_626115 [Globomyces pollinis-pini]KAI8892169.1 hypothetical protein BC833DRAFT_626091 [Globomyces pollinis-pini]